MPRSPCRRIRLASVTSQMAAKAGPGWATLASAKPGTSNGCQDHTVLPYANCAARPARESIAHGRGPPCDPSRAQRCCVHRSPHSTYRDDAYAPLHEAGWPEEDSNLGKGKADYFLRLIWTIQITLNRLVKFVSTRKAFYSISVARPRDRRADGQSVVAIAQARPITRGQIGLSRSKIR
jgi:hypothetical protein